MAEWLEVAARLTAEQIDSPAVGGCLLDLLGRERWRVRSTVEGYSFLQRTGCKHGWEWVPVETLGQACMGAAAAMGWTVESAA
jgi:hypothetical protein